MDITEAEAVELIDGEASREKRVDRQASTHLQSGDDADNAQNRFTPGRRFRNYVDREEDPVRRRNKRATRASDGRVVAVPTPTGLAVFGDPVDVDAVLNNLTAAASRTAPVRRTLLNAASLAASVEAIAAKTGEFVQLSPETVRQLTAQGATPGQTAGYFSGAVRGADGAISSFVEWAPWSDPRLTDTYCEAGVARLGRSPDASSTSAGVPSTCCRARPVA